MINDKIKFGTDGWRAVIASDFTFRNVERVSQAIADYLGRKGSHRPFFKKGGIKVVIGYDTRFMSSIYAHLIGEVLSGNNIKTVVSSHVTPTPMLSYKVKHDGFNGGVMVTASHNPGIYNGIKFKEPFGGSALPSTTKKLEDLIDKSKVVKSNELVREENIAQIYVSALKKYLNNKSMRRKKYKIVIDSMYGAGGFYLENILKGFGHEVVTIHGNPNPLFPGINPEPIEKNLKELSKTVRDTGADIGIATDGDADRVGVVSGDGKFLTPHQVLSLLFLHLKTSRSWDGIVIKTISTTSLIYKIANKYNIPVKETPVGFKYVVDWMLKDDVLIGGEESGGNGFRKHIPERDGLLSGLLLVEMMGERKKGLKQLISDMEKEFGPYKYKRIDQHLSQERIKRLYNICKDSPPDSVLGYKVKEIKADDGIKFILEDDSWLLLRGSGTEPLLRMYSEAKTIKQVDELISAGQQLVKQISSSIKLY